MKNLIKNIIADFHYNGAKKFRKRDYTIPLNSRKIITLIGPRRSGKTFMLYQLMEKIEDITDIIYINFEDERLKFSPHNFQQIVDAYFEMYPNKAEENIYFFFDEIQEVTGWEKFVRRIYDSISQKIFLTGSSAKLLSREIATSLRGRTISYEIFPLSFKEYLQFNVVPAEIYSTKGKAKCLAYLEKYLFTSSFPETIGMDKMVFEKTLRTYLDVMLYRDVIERYNVSNFLILKYLMHTLLANTGNEYSVNKIFNNFKSQGLSISKDSLYKYVNYLHDAYILFSVNNFTESIAKTTSRKTYTIDQGLSSMVSFTLSKDKGRLLESIVFLELRRRYEEIFYFKNRAECDFIIKEKNKITHCFQVCYEINENNKKREVAGLKEAMERFGLKNGKILTWDFEKTENNIQYIPAYKWLLE